MSLKIQKSDKMFDVMFLKKEYQTAFNDISNYIALS